MKYLDHLKEWLIASLMAMATILVDRSKYPLTLTAAGKFFNDTASEAIRLLNDAPAQLRTQQTAQERVNNVPASALETAMHGALKV